MIDLQALCAKFPAEYAAVFAAGRADGVAAERDRVQGHLVAARMAGALELAHTAIGDGREVGAVASEYLSIGLRHRDIDLRNLDEASVAAAVDGAQGTATSTAAGKSPADIVADAVVAGLKEGL